MSLSLSLEAHLLKCCTTFRLYLKLLSHKMQPKRLTSECTSWWVFKSPAVKKRFRHSLQTYGFTSSWRGTCFLRSPRLVNFFWQMLQTSQVPSLCDSTRCRFSWWDHIKRSEQCLHECGFVSVWIRTWSFTSMFVLNIFPQKGHWYGLLLLCTWRLCACKWVDLLKCLLHSEHLYGLSPVWTLMWLFRFPDWLNDLSHMWHLYGLSKLWILLCVIRLPNCVNRLLQTVHSNGFSPEWLRLCSASSLLLWQHLPHSVHLYLLVWIYIWVHRTILDEQRFPQWLQEYNRSPVCLSLVWTLMWLLNALSHMWHLCGLSPLWILLCITRLPVVVNRLLQTAHSNGFSPEWLRLCTASALLLWQRLPHSAHLYLLVWIFICWYRALWDE